MAKNEEQRQQREVRTQLSDLVRSRRAEMGLSLRGLEARCVDPENSSAGPQLKYSWIDRLEKHAPVIPPQLPELRALAAGLQLPLRMVQEAAGAQFLGIDALWSPSGDVRALVQHVESLSEDDRAKILAIAEAWTARNESSPDSSG